MPNHDPSTQLKQSSTSQRRATKESASLSLRHKRWQTLPPFPPGHQARFPELDRLTVQILYNRRITTPQEAEDFLHRVHCSGDPLQLKGMAQAIKNIERAITANEKIAVYGDFDVDGVTATALMVETLQALGAADVVPHIPHRTREERGLNLQALRKLWQGGVRLVITVDCGIRDVSEVEQARAGLDIIITDHHSIGSALPPALAIINPKQAGCPYPFKELAGVGVAFKLAQALLKSPRLTKGEPHLVEDDLLDLVALGTVADLAPLRGENRALVYRGLKCISHTERPGIEALCQQAGLKPEQVNATAIGFALGPPLNAAGRMEHANIAYRLLIAKYPAEAERLADKLDQLNQKRRLLTSKLYDRAREVALSESPDSSLIFVASPEFSAGIAGLVATRLVDQFYRPAVVVEMGDEVSRGSCRSIPEFHITDALDECTGLLVRHGGHAAAAGFTARTQDLAKLKDRLLALATEELEMQKLMLTLQVDADIPLQEMNKQLWEKLQRLEPFGKGNPHPLFLSRNVRLLGQRAVGKEGRHLKLRLSDDRATWDGIAFRQGEWAGKLPDRVDIVYHLEVNEWNDQRRLQLNVQDVRPSGLDDTIARLWLDQDGPESKEA